MEIEVIAESAVFFLFATIVILGAVGMILAQRVAHSILDRKSVV